MSLSERAGGILETHVTWRDIELDMQEALGTVATFGPNKTVKNIGEGNGFMSRIGLIDADWQNVQDDEDLPKTFIAKICSQLTMLDFSAKMEHDMKLSEDALKQLESQSRRVHNVEVSSYILLNKYAPGRIALPKIYATKKFSEANPNKGYIVMEHMADLVPVHIVDNIDCDGIRQALRAAAVFESVSLKFTDDERKDFESKLFADFFGPIFTPEVYTMMTDMMRKIGGDKLAERCDKFEKIVPDILTRENLLKLDNLSDNLGMTRVFCHGDLWSTNMLWRKPDNKYKLMALIDFQTAHMGCPGGDLGRLLCANMSGEGRREHLDTLLGDFYGYLREEVEGEMPYTLEQLKRSYEIFFPFAAFVVVPTIAPMMEYIAKHRTEEREAASQDDIMEKTVCLLDDMIAMYEKNKNEENHE